LNYQNVLGSVWLYGNRMISGCLSSSPKTLIASVTSLERSAHGLKSILPYSRPPSAFFSKAMVSFAMIKSWRQCADEPEASEFPDDLLVFRPVQAEAAQYEPVHGKFQIASKN
jgi:hypothetical protein